MGTSGSWWLVAGTAAVVLASGGTAGSCCLVAGTTGVVLARGGQRWVVLAHGGHCWVVLAHGGHCRGRAGGHFCDFGGYSGGPWGAPLMTLGALGTFNDLGGTLVTLGGTLVTWGGALWVAMGGTLGALL